MSSFLGAGRIPGALGSDTNRPLIDSGTQCRSRSAPPGVLGVVSPPLFRLPVLVGEAMRKPGFNFDGTPAEDWQYGDKPAKSAAIKADPMFAHNDELLGRYLRQLMESLSIGSMETVAVAMQEQFCAGKGGTFQSETLDAEIAGNPAFHAYRVDFERKLGVALHACCYELPNIKPVMMKLLNFSSFWDKVTGLGVTVHQVWSAKAEVENFLLNDAAGFWRCTLKYTFYDHYGLDWEDVVKHGEDRIPQYHTGDCFKAWYILQHYRSARPLLTVMNESIALAGRAY